VDNNLSAEKVEKQRTKTNKKVVCSILQGSCRILNPRFPLVVNVGEDPKKQPEKP